MSVSLQPSREMTIKTLNILKNIYIYKYLFINKFYFLFLIEGNDDNNNNNKFIINGKKGTRRSLSLKFIHKV